MPAVMAERPTPIVTPGDPGWDALTATGSPLDYLYGMTAESDWQPGATLTMALDDQWRLTGEVLVAERPRRLSYTLGDRSGEPSAYVSWELRTVDDATIIRLYVDEPLPQADVTDDLEAAWLPVLSGLVTRLDRCAPPRPATSEETL